MTPHQDEVAQVGIALRELGVAGSVVEAIQTLVRSDIAHQQPWPSPPAADEDIGRLARHLHKQSVRRGELLGDLFVNLAWNMLLDLVAADACGQGVPVSSLCIASGGAATTALRHIGWLEAQGFTRRTVDPDDGRRALVYLTDEARATAHAAILAAPARALIG